MAETNHDLDILRYRRAQRVVHAVMASSFLILLITGLALVWSPLSWIAAGGWSRYLHRIAAVGFMSVPFLYLWMDRAGAREVLVESFIYDKDDVKWFTQMYRYALGRTAEMPPQGRLNAGQKLHHSAVIVFSAVIVLSGLVLWWLKSSLSTSMLSWTAIIHDLAMLALTLLLVGHVFFTFVYKAWSSMATGYVSKEDMEMEHSKWVEELEHEAAEDSLAQSRVSNKDAGVSPQGSPAPPQTKGK
ncbi:MAG: cytochrome b/b6 domain-containing protein [Actinomycetota bacterium]